MIAGPAKSPLQISLMPFDSTQACPAIPAPPFRQSSAGGSMRCTILDAQHLRLRSHWSPNRAVAPASSGVARRFPFGPKTISSHVLHCECHRGRLHHACFFYVAYASRLCGWLRHFNPIWLRWCVSFANWLILENALMALDNAARCGQMLTVGS
jgi:hypothetical protein